MAFFILSIAILLLRPDPQIQIHFVLSTRLLKFQNEDHLPNHIQLVFLLKVRRTFFSAAYSFHFG